MTIRIDDDDLFAGVRTKYPSLSVRVSGYSALLVDLPSSLQDDIVARTEFCEV